MVAAPHGRPVALTLGPPLNLPLGGGGRWLADPGTRCCGRGVAVKGVLVVWVEMACFAFLWIPASAGMTWRGYCGEFRASPCSLRSRPPSRSEGGESLSPAPAAVESLVSAQVSKGFLGVKHHSDVMFRGVVLGEGVSECVGFVGALHPVGLDDVFGFE